MDAPLSPTEEKVQSGQILSPKNEQASPSVDSKDHDSSEMFNSLSPVGCKDDEVSSISNFEEALKTMQSRDESKIPESLQGGVLLEKTYVVEPKDINRLLFEPNSQFRREIADKQGTSDYQEGPWTWKHTESPCLTRSVTYIKEATKLVKAVKATEEQIYLKADGNNFVVLVRVDTPDVPYGSCFQVQLLYKMMSGSKLSSGEESSHVVISWNIDFRQSTVMRSVIEKTARQGLRESYGIFAEILAQYVKQADKGDLGFDKQQLLAPLEEEHHSDWELAIEYLCNLTVICTIFMWLYVILHIIMPGLEFNGLDLPDTVGELIVCGILFFQGERVFNMVSRFVKARLQRGSDHGIKAQGDGWLVTVALIEGSNLPVLASSGLLDPYVVFSCSGQMRTSSVQLQTRDPLWNDILEFDALKEPPSVLNAEVFDFDGPFDQAVCIGHVEINFLKYKAEKLADMWIPLDGELAQASHSKLHLRVFLDNTKGSETIIEFLSEVEKEVGKKLSPRSPHRNSTFQRHFGLPPEEFLIDAFSCYLKRKLPFQGKLFLSTRIIGFHANFLGHKTTFFFLWEDIEDIQLISPSFATVGSPALLIILRSGHGHDARHGAISKDKEGRLKFQFQSFVSFNSASREIMALWRTKAIHAEQSAKLEEDRHSHSRISGQIVKQFDEDQDQSGSSDQADDGERILSFDGTSLSKAFSAELSVPLILLMEIFGGGQLEKKIMEKVGCLNYSVTQWEAVRPEHVFERSVIYKCNRHVSIFGGDVTSVQRKSPTSDRKGWMVDEAMTLHSVPFGDHFRVYLKYIMTEIIVSGSTVSQCDVFVHVRWLRSTTFKKRITRNIHNKLTHRSKEMLELAEKEFLYSAKSLE